MEIPVSFNPEQGKLVRLLAKTFGKPNFNLDGLYQLRRNLGDLRHYHRGNTQIIQRIDAVLWWLKQGAGIKPTGQPHALSDHAFLRYYERELGVDVMGLKDAVLKDAEDRGVFNNFVKHKGHYVTYIKE